MLNILLGVGFSGAFVTLSSFLSLFLSLLLFTDGSSPFFHFTASGKPYPILFSPTLFASAVGLLTLLLLTLSLFPLLLSSSSTSFDSCSN